MHLYLEEDGWCEHDERQNVIEFPADESRYQEVILNLWEHKDTEENENSPI